MRRVVVLAMAPLLLWIADRPAVTGAETTPRYRNVLLMIADDQGLHAGCYGDHTVRTPNIDQLAAMGVRFTHGFAAVSSCSPSRSTILTGLYNHTNGQYGLAHTPHYQHTFPFVETLPRLLKESGYVTGIVGKMHVEPESLYPFDLHVEGQALTGNRDVSKMARLAGEFITAHRDRPFFLVVGFSDPHRDAQDAFANDREYPNVEKVTYDPASIQLPYFLPDLPEVRADVADYYAAVSRLDTGVGLVMKELESSGRSAETLVIYLSDNGMPFPGAKTNLYDPGLRLPLIVVSPEQKKRGITSDAMASWVDVTPTILDWTGAKGPAKYALPGRSWLPILAEEHPQAWDEIHASHTMHQITMYYPMRALRTRQYKYILNLEPAPAYPQASDITGSPSWKAMTSHNLDKLGRRTLATYIQRPAEELYDLEKDPDELVNVADQPAHAAALKDLRARMFEFRRKTDDTWLAEVEAARSKNN